MNGLRHTTARRTARALTVLWLALGSFAGKAQTADPYTRNGERRLTTRATGTFDVKLAPQTSTDSALGRMSIDKQFHGDLDGTSKGEMLAAMTVVKNSAGYVAIEKVTGTLHGRRGTFVLQHSGTMNRGAPQLLVTVVPDSGTDQLTGLTGTMNIIVEGPKHSYEFDYTLPVTP